MQRSFDEDEFDSSDEEDGPADNTPLSLDWLEFLKVQKTCIQSVHCYEHVK